MRISVSMNSKREWVLVETPICETCGSTMRGFVNEVKNYANDTQIEYDTFYCPNCTKTPHSQQLFQFGEGDWL